MSYKIDWALSAAKSFDKLDHPVKTPVKKYLDKLENEMTLKHWGNP
jgi:mRNA-degrading endonuclease RelE of RelBE toxin-antitoxin system